MVHASADERILTLKEVGWRLVEAATGQVIWRARQLWPPKTKCKLML